MIHLKGWTNRVGRCTVSADSYSILVGSSATINAITRGACTSNDAANYSVSGGDDSETIVAL